MVRISRKQSTDFNPLEGLAEVVSLLICDDDNTLA